MDLRQIEAFYWIATLGSFSAAANRLFVTQSAISSRVLALEAELGVSLFDRTARKLKLSSKGAEIFEYAQHLLETSAKIKEISSSKAMLRGTIRIGVINTVAHVCLTELIRELDTRFPEVVVDFEVGNDPAIRSMFERHDVELILGLGEMKGPGLKSEFLCRYPVDWIASTTLKLPEGVVPIEELAKHRIITYHRAGHIFHLISDRFRKHGVWPIRLSGTNSVAAVTRLLIANIGIGVMPSVSVAEEINEGRLRVLKSEVLLPDVEFFVTYPREPFNELSAVVADVARKICSDSQLGASAGKGNGGVRNQSALK